MIRKICTILVCLSLLSLSHIQAQPHIKPAFKYWVHATYETKLSGAKKQVEISDLQEINEAGLAHLKTKYYKGVTDTSFYLSDDQIQKLNTIFNGSKKLTSYMVANKLPPGRHYAGPLEYLYYIDARGKSDELLLVDAFMDDGFNQLVQSVFILPSKVDQKVKSIKNPVLTGKILKCESSCTYLPKIEQPPTVLEIVK
ncbi:hypothetical protein G7092_10260 [Mucilaginibacter sp. HC2]|nr:hypothetical protein [Mucilaginibacter inviolabilis]